MRVVCINSDNYYLTLGKIYEIENITDWKYIGSVTRYGKTYLTNHWIVNDKGKRHTIETHLFKPLDELRLEKLDILLS
jgi:hypothetical protein